MRHLKNILKTKKRIVLAILFIIALSCLFFTLSLFSSPRYVQHISANKNIIFKVITFNLFWNGDSKKNSELLQKTGADIICLQETTNEMFNEFSKQTGNTYPYKILHTRKSGNGPAIFSKFPISDSEYIESQYGMNGWWSGYVSVNGKKVKLVNLHLHPTWFEDSAAKGLKKYVSGFIKCEDIRKKEIDEILLKVNKEESAIILGDFNSTSCQYPVKTLAAKGFIDSLAVLHKNADDMTTVVNPSIKIKQEFRIDFIFHTKDIYSIQSEVIREGGSDHFPVISCLQFCE